MKHLLMAVCLTCVLSVSAFAGDMPMDSPAPPPPAPIRAEIPIVDSTAPGEIPTCCLSLVTALLDLAF